MKLLSLLAETLLIVILFLTIFLSGCAPTNGRSISSYKDQAAQDELFKLKGKRLE